MEKQQNSDVENFIEESGPAAQERPKQQEEISSGMNAGDPQKEVKVIMPRDQKLFDPADILKKENILKGILYSVILDKPRARKKYWR